MDLSTDGMTLPLLVAAGLAVLQYLTGNKAPAAPGQPGVKLPDLLGILLGTRKESDKVTISVTTDRPEVIEAVRKAAEQPKG